MAKFSLEAVFRGIDKMSAPVSRMASRVNRATRQMGEGVRRLTGRFQKLGRASMQALGPGGLAGAIAGVGLAMGAVIMKGAEFEQTLVGAASRFGDGIEKNSAQFKELEKLSRDLGATTEFTASDAAGGLNFLAKAGFDAQLSMSLLPGILDLATATELDLARASDIATDSLGAFGLAQGDAATQTKNFTKLSDQMAKTVRIANVDMEQLFETVVKGAPAATAATVPVETFLALTAQLAGAGLKASDAGTAVKNIFLALVKTPVQKKLKTMGVQVLDTAGNMRDFADIMDDLNAAFERSGTGQAARAGVINELFGLRGITGVANVLQTGTGKIRGLRDEISDSVGETERLAKVLRDTRSGQIKELTSAFESLTLSISAATDDGIGKMIEGLTEGVRTMDAFVKNNPELTRLAGLLLVVAGVGLVVAAVFAGMAAAVAFVASSVPAMIAALAAGVAAVGGFIGSLKPVQDFLDGIFEGSQFLQSVGNFLTGDVDAEADRLRALEGPNDRAADRTIDERRETNEAKLTIEDRTGTAELEGSLGRGTGLELAESGAFD